MICIEFEYENVNKTIFWWPVCLTLDPETHLLLQGQKAPVLVQTIWNKEC